MLGDGTGPSCLISAELQVDSVFAPVPYCSVQTQRAAYSGYTFISHRKQEQETTK